MHFIYDVARKITEAARTGRRATLWGDGYQRREVLAVDDFVTAMLELIQADSNWGAIINVASGADYTIREFAAVLCELVGIPNSLVAYDTAKYVGARSKLLETTQLKRLLPWHPQPMDECARLVLKAVGA